MTEELAAELENDIIFGVYAPGSRIVEDRVMERYGAKRHIVRAAFATLEGRRLLVRHPNRGVEVVEFTPDDVDGLYDVRLILETAAAERTPLPCPREITDEMRDIAGRHSEAVRRKDFRSVFALNKEFHEVQYACCGNPMLTDLIRQHALAAQPIRVVKYEDRDHMATVVEQHFAIIDAMESGSNEVYVAATRAHLPASATAYRFLYETRHGKRVSSA